MSFLWSISAPWIYVGGGEARRHGIIPSWFYTADGLDVCVRKFRGWKMKDVPGLMNEFGAALQFFDDFGENWYALEECLSYLDEWLPAQAYVFVIERAEEMLVDDDQSLEAFLKTLQIVGDRWSKPVSGPERFKRDPVPFHVLLNVSESNAGGINRIRDSAAAMGIPVLTGWNDVA